MPTELSSARARAVKAVAAVLAAGAVSSAFRWFGPALAIPLVGAPLAAVADEF